MLVSRKKYTDLQRAKWAVDDELKWAQERAQLEIDHLERRLRDAHEKFDLLYRASMAERRLDVMSKHVLNDLAIRSPAPFVVKDGR